MSVVGSGAVLGLGIQRHQLAGRGVIPFQPRASQVFQPGSAVVHRIGAALAEVPTARPDLVSLGSYVGFTTFTASSTADANGGAVDPVTLQPQTITIHPFDRTGYFASGTGVDAITFANLDEPCFWSDDDTLCLTDAGGTRSFAGYVDDVPSTGPGAGRVVLRSNLEIRGLYELYSAGELTPGTGVGGTARCVITTIAAFAAAGGVITASATGAIGAQDSTETLLAGDPVFLPVVTGGAGAGSVTAALSGPYVVTSPGGSGVKFVLTRPAGWKSGDIVGQASDWKVKFGTIWAGNTWRSFPTTAIKVIDTDDPHFWPRTWSALLTAAGANTTAWIRDVNKVSAMNITGVHAFWASTLTAGAGNGAITITGTSAEQFATIATNF